MLKTSWEKEKVTLQAMKDEAERKSNELNEQVCCVCLIGYSFFYLIAILVGLCVLLVYTIYYCYLFTNCN